MSYSTFNQHASSSSGGTLRELSQKIGWRESLGRWTKVGLFVGVALGSALPTMGLAGNVQPLGIPVPTKPAIPTTGTGVIQGVKFNDLNGNGTKNPGEKGLANEIINIRSADGTTFKSMTTDLNGNYIFGGLELGNYTIWTGVYPTDWAIAGEADWQQTTPEKGEFPPDHLVTLSADNAIINFGTWNGVEINLDFVVDAGGNHAIESGEKVNYQGTFLDANSEGKHTVVWDFGDGNSKKQVVDGSTGVRKAVRAITAAIPIRANNMPAQTGTLTTTATVTAADGKTATDTTTTIVRDNKTDPCTVGVPTVQSVKSGDWSDPNTWSPATVPDSKAWVIISAGTTVTLKEPPITDSSKAYPVKGLCVGKNATLTSAANSYGQPVTWVAIQAINIHNQGTVKGANGLDGIDPDGSGPKPFQHATGGSNIILRGNQLINDGTIIAGNGGKDSTWTFMKDNGTNAIGGAGGAVELYPTKITNNGLIQGGNGGIADRCNDSVTLCVHGNGIGGNGGLVRIMATNVAGSTNVSTGQIVGGRGGDAEVWYNGTHGSAGTGGNVEVNIGVNNGTIQAGGRGSTVRVDPTTLKFGSTTRISDADNIVIFGGEDWTMELNNLSEGAISAAKTITIAVGKGGVVDFRGSAANALKAAEKVEIFADSVVLDDGVTLQQLVQTPNLVTGPAKILYHAAWSGVQYIVAEPGETVPIAMTLLNGGPTADTYTLTMTHFSGEFVVGEIPADATVNSQRRTEIEFEVTLPKTRGTEDVITLTATSQNDSSVKAVAEIHLSVKPAEIVTPPPVTGPYTASGTIKDKFGPVAGVTVQIAGKSATTDAAGNWEITGLTAGNYTAEANKDGYLSLIQQFDVSEAMPTAKVPLKLASLLKVGVSTQPKVAKAGDNVTYLVSVTNNGTRPATNLVLKDVIPAGTSLISLDGANCDTHTMICTFSELAAGQTATVKLIVNAPQAGQLENTATVTATDYPAEVNVSIKEIVPTLSVLTQCTPNPVPMLESLHCVATVNLGPTATEAATGVTVVTTLPTGVELQAATTTFGTCDTSKLPAVTCQLNDLSSGNNATINLDLALKDAGLLVLTQETTVSASNYGSHSAKTRTNIFIPAEIQVDLALVIDITGSMQGEIDGAKAALKKFIATLDSNTSPLIALIVFKDEVTVKAFTQDMTVLLKAIDSLKAEGGGTCPEASVEAVEVGALHVKPGGQIWFSTDASPYADADVQGVLDLLQSKNIRFNATVTGDCSNGDSANEAPWEDVVNQ